MLNEIRFRKFCRSKINPYLCILSYEPKLFDNKLCDFINFLKNTHQFNSKETMPNVKRVYTFGNKQAEGNGKMRELLGGKGANLAEMNLVGIPVPPGFTITTEVCTEYYTHGREEVIKLIKPDVEAAMKGVEKNMGMEFGSSTNPLLLSVRSGARASMPGMT